MAKPEYDSEHAQWLEILAGRQQAARDGNSADPLVRASQLRSYFEKRDAHELERKHDPVWETELLERVRKEQRGPSHSSAKVRTFKPPLWKQAIDCLLPPNQGSSGRYAAFATLAMVAVLLSAILQQSQDSDPVDGVAKGSIEFKQKSYWVLLAQPEAAARQFCADLITQSISCAVLPVANGFRATIQFNAEQMGLLRSRVLPWGIPVPLSGHLVINFGGVV